MISAMTTGFILPAPYHDEYVFIEWRAILNFRKLQRSGHTQECASQVRKVTPDGRNRHLYSQKGDSNKMLNPHTKIVILVASLYYPEMDLPEILDEITNRSFIKRLGQRVSRDIRVNQDNETFFEGLKLSEGES